MRLERMEAGHGPLVALPRVGGLHHRYTRAHGSLKSHGAKPFLVSLSPLQLSCVNTGWA